MAYILGGEGSATFTRFEKLCCEAYNHLRSHTSLIVTLFSLMLSTGLPELQTYTDVEYLVHTLSPELTDDGAAQKFRGLIKESLHCKTTQVNNAAHIAQHYGL